MPPFKVTQTCHIILKSPTIYQEENMTQLWIVKGHLSRKLWSAVCYSDAEPHNPECGKILNHESRMTNTSADMFVHKSE